MRITPCLRILVLGAAGMAAALSRGADSAPVAGATAAARPAGEPEVVKMEQVQVKEQATGAEAKFANKAGTEALTEVVAGADLKNPNAQSSADLLKNTSGVTVSGGTNGSSNVSVRGIDQRMLRITVDGQRQGGTGNALDNIPPEIVQSLEVTKTFTPDMEADAVGGVINVNTGGTVIKSAYEQGRHQVTYNLLDPRSGTRNSLTLARPFNLFAAESKAGADKPKPNASLLVTASFDDAYKTRERLSTLRAWTAQRSPGPAPYAGQEIPVLTLPLIEDTLEHRQRTGLVTNFDARLGDMAVFWRANLNRDWAKRNRDYDDTNPATGTPVALTPTSGVFSGVRASRRNQQQVAQRDAANLSFGAKARVGRVDYDATLGYSLTREFEPRTVETVFVSDRTYRVGYDLQPDAYIPVRTAVDETNPADTTSIADPTRYRFDNLTITHTEARDEEASAKLNAKLGLANAAQSGDYLKFGGKLQQRHRRVDTDREVEDAGVVARTMTGLVGTPTATMQTTDCRFGPVANSRAVADALLATPGFFQRNATESLINSSGGDYAITETVWALYGMGRIKRGLLTWLGGVRVEGTRVSSKANAMVFDPTGKLQGFAPARAGSSYAEVLPGLHLRYDPTPGRLYRASVTRSLSRPAYADIPPFRSLSFIDHRSRVGAPDLKPYQSTNLDLSVDTYSERGGLLSLAVFYKKIDHFITDAQYATTIGNLGQFIEFRRVNGETAQAMGFEANWQGRTWALPAGLGKGSVEANYSFNHGEAHHPTRPGETFPLPRQVDHQGSVKFHGERQKLSLDASVRYRTGWWEDLIAAGFDNYIRDTWETEISAAYKLGKDARLTAGVSNLLDLPQRHYAGSKARMNDYQRSGVDFNAGVQWKL